MANLTSPWGNLTEEEKKLQSTKPDPITLALLLHQNRGPAGAEGPQADPAMVSDAADAAASMQDSPALDPIMLSTLMSQVPDSGAPSKAVMQQQLADIDNQRNYLNTLAAQKQGVDISPVANFVSNVLGVKTDYTPPKSNVDKVQEAYKSIIGEQNKVLENQARGQMAAQKLGLLQQAAERGNARLGLQKDKLSLQQDTQASKAADTIHANKNIVGLTQQIQNGERANDILLFPGMSVQDFNDAQLEIGKSIAGTGQFTDSKFHKTEYNTMQQRIAQATANLTGLLPSDPVPNDILEHVKQINNITLNDFKKNRYTQAQRLKRSYSSNPKAETEQDKAIKKYDPNAPREDTPAASAGDPMLEWAKRNVNNPQYGADAQKILQLHGVK